MSNGKGKGLPGRPLPQPAVAPAGTCPIGERCHVSGKGIKTFGTKFKRSTVADLATSSVALAVQNAGALQFFGSGTLIRASVVLCAAHSVQNLTSTDVRVALFVECDAKTAPAGHRGQASSPSAWTSCTKLNASAQARVVKKLEEGSASDMDYTLFAIEWTTFTPGVVAGQKFIQVSRPMVIPQPSSNFSKEVLMVGHHENEPTQASAGALLSQFAPHPEKDTGVEYGYATFTAGRAGGASGGGVFNEQGQMIGVLKGTSAKRGGLAFLNLGAVANALPNSRIANWLKNGDPLLAGDPREDAVFKT